MEEIEAARAAGDSIGGSVELCVLGLPVGLGEPPFAGVENRLSQALYAVPAIKCIEFGAGSAVSHMRGSEHNDPYVMENGKVKTSSNRHGGILGGITSGMPVIFRCAFKPTPSIAKEQQTVNLATNEAEALVIGGRHDPCIVQRAVPCVEAAAAVAIADFIL